MRRNNERALFAVVGRVVVGLLACVDQSKASDTALVCHLGQQWEAVVEHAAQALGCTIGEPCHVTQCSSVCSAAPVRMLARVPAVGTNHIASELYRTVRNACGTQRGVCCPGCRDRHKDVSRHSCPGPIPIEDTILATAYAGLTTILVVLAYRTDLSDA